MTNGGLEHDASLRYLSSLFKPRCRPHVVILGAGASRAACLKGDANGKHLPLMQDFVRTLGLESAISAAGLDPDENFEVLYGGLFASDPNGELLRTIEREVERYFASLALPPFPNVYDLLLLSLRPKDAIFTFNWDPFLADAYRRNFNRYCNRGVQLPRIFHLHGNVRAAYCESCQAAMERASRCHRCQGELAPTPLLYPIESKNYDASPFLCSQWDQARWFLNEAFLVTIFGYSAPKSDQAAMDILQTAWRTDDKTKDLFHWVEIIDIRDHDEVSRQWQSFYFKDHYTVCQSLSESRLGMYPRRSCEALFNMNVRGDWGVDAIAWTESPSDIDAALTVLAAVETDEA